VLASAGHHVETPADVVAWAGRRTSALLLLTVTGDPEWRLLARLRESGRTLPVVAVMDLPSAQQCARAVRAGADSVLHRSATADALRRTVEATMDGQMVLPALVGALLAATAPVEEVPTVRADRIGWLQQMAAGTTVAQLAVRAGYSERAMFRLLTGLYKELGVRNRIEAIVLARDRGWI
jgi:DNA-binding NarL/FixJ family response regulator